MGMLPFPGGVVCWIQAHNLRAMGPHDTCELFCQGSAGACQQQNPMLGRRQQLLPESQGRSIDHIALDGIV